MNAFQIESALAAVDANHFAIVESGEVMVYSKDSFYPTPIPVHKESHGFGSAYVPQKKCADCSHSTVLAPHEYACDAGKTDDTLSCFSPKKSY